MTFLISLLLVGVFAVVIVLLIKQSNKKLQETVDTLSEEQKQRLMATEIILVPGKKNSWSQEGLIVKATDKGSKMALYVLYCNKTIQNNFFNKITCADIKMNKTDFETRSLGVGSFVTIEVDAEKGNAVVL